MILSTESQQRNPSKAHLHPANNGRDFTDSAVTHDSSTSNVLVNPAFKVEFKVDAEHDLSDEEKGDERSEVRVNVTRKLSALVCMAKEPSHN